MTDWESFLEFRVVLPGELQTDAEIEKRKMITGLIYGGIGAVVFVALAATVVVVMKRRN